MNYKLFVSPFLYLLVFFCSSCKQSTDSNSAQADPVIVGTSGNIGHDIYYSDYLKDYATPAKGIHSLNFDASGKAFLFRNVNLYSSPRGSKMAFALKNTLYLADINGQSAEKLFTTGPEIQYAILSPDGEKVIYATHYDASLNILVDSLNIYDIKAHTHTPLAAPDFYLLSGNLPVFSDDSKKIILSLGLDPLAEAGPLFTVNSDGTGLTQITSDATINFYSENITYFWQPFTWSPDGKSICYEASSKESSTPDSLMIVDLASGIPVKISDSAYRPVWSPNGNNIAFYHEFPNSVSHIGIFDVHTKQIRFIDPSAPYTGGAAVVDWTSDGKALIVGASQADPKADGSTLKIDVATGNILTNYSFNTFNFNTFRAKALGEH